MTSRRSIFDFQLAPGEPLQMASAIPLALSLLQTVAPISQGPQKPATNGSLNPPAATQSSNPTKQTTSSPVNIPTSQSSTTSNHRANSTMATGSPPSKTSSSLCDVSTRKRDSEEKDVHHRPFSIATYVPSIPMARKCTCIVAGRAR